MVDLIPPGSEAEVFVMERRFAAPRDLVWKAWTDPAHLAKWFILPGMTFILKSADIRPGGALHYGMQGPMGVMWGRFAYQAVEAPERLAYVTSFTDEAGAPVRHPMSPMWPLEVLAIQTFTESGGATLMHSRSYPINATPEERHVFTAGFASMQMGFGAVYAQLDLYLAHINGAAA